MDGDQVQDQQNQGTFVNPLEARVETLEKKLEGLDTEELKELGAKVAELDAKPAVVGTEDDRFEQLLVVLADHGITLPKPEEDKSEGELVTAE